MKVRAKKIVKKLREKGIMHYLRILHRFLLFVVIPKYGEIYVFEFGFADFKKESNQRKDVAVGIARDIEEILHFVKSREKWYYDYAKRLFEKGNLCFYGVYNNRIVSCVWTSFNESYIPNVEYTFRTRACEVSLIDGFTLPQYRGMHIYTVVWNACIKYLKGTGKYNKAYGFVMPSNRHSLAVHRQLRLERIVMRIKLLRIFGVRWHFKKRYTYET